MIILVFLLLAGGSLVVYLWFSSLSASRLWQTAFFLSLGMGIVRTAFAVLGEMILQHQSNWLQIPAYAMALARLPEAALLPESLRSSHFFLGLAIFLGTAGWVFVIAWIAAKRRRRKQAA